MNFEHFHAHVTMFGTTYDYNSILHYSDNAFAKKDGMKTLDPKFPAPDMGQRDGD
jgi:hypothetical protein